MKIGLIAIAAAVIAAAISLWLNVREEGPRTSDPGPRPAERPQAAGLGPQAPEKYADATVHVEQDGARVVSPARDEREAALQSLLDSGEAKEEWVDRATNLFDLIGRQALATSKLGCYVAGCGATFTFPSVAEFDRRRAIVEASDEYKAWTGGKKWTTPEPTPDGRIVVALILYRPD